MAFNLPTDWAAVSNVSNFSTILRTSETSIPAERAFTCSFLKTSVLSLPNADNAGIASLKAEAIASGGISIVLAN